MYGKAEMSHCYFKLNVIDFAGSISGTYIIYKLSQIINKNNAYIIKRNKYIISIHRKILFGDSMFSHYRLLYIPVVCF